MRRDPDRHEAATLAVREQLAFERIVQRETTRAGRYLLARWARPDDAHPHADQALTETFRLLWRT